MADDAVRRSNGEGPRTVPHIQVEGRTDVEQVLSRFIVRVSDDKTSTSHEVTLSRSDSTSITSHSPRSIT